VIIPISHTRENIRLKIQSKNSYFGQKNKLMKSYILYFILLHHCGQYCGHLPCRIHSSFFGPDWIYLSLHLAIVWSHFDQRSIGKRKALSIAGSLSSPIYNITFNLNYAQVDCTATRS